MLAGKKIPYGISNFRDLIMQGYLYVDKSHYIETLENYSEKYIFFLRPRRFGKSLFVSLLSSYYDIKGKDEFANLFGGLYIGEHPTRIANSYYILHFNFSSINTSDQERLVEDFTHRVLDALNVFCQRYQVKVDYPDKGMPAQIFNAFLSQVAFQIGGKIYLLIDEYDHFANELLSFQVELFEETVSKTGFVRKWYEALKIGTEKGIIDRIFATGVSPVALDGLTSGFNIAKNKTRDRNLNEMMGFTEEEVQALCQNLLGDTGIVPELKRFYNGYLFSEDAEKRVFNSDMVLYYLTEYQQVNKPPKDLVDTNISSDYSKLQSLFALKNKARNVCILERILQDEPQVTSLTREYSLAKEFTEADFLSLLFYLGFLTIDRAVLNRVKLKIPNYIIRETYFDFFAKIVREAVGSELENRVIENCIESIALKGQLDGLIELVERTLASLSNRDYLRFDEKYVKLLFMTYMMLSKLYYIKSEYEVRDGYIDLAFFDRWGREEIYEGLLELKYVKKSDYAKHGQALIQQKLEEGKRQMESYSDAEELKGKKMLIKWVLVFAGEQCVERLRID